MLNGKILILEDDKELANHYYDLLKETYIVKLSHASTEFFNIYDEFVPDLLILDIKLKKSLLNGVEVFEKLKSERTQIPNVIILSGEASRKEIAQTMKMGAYTFIEKSGEFNVEKFLIDVKQALNQKLQEKSNLSLRQDKENLRKSLINSNVLIGESKKMKYIKKLIAKFAKADIDILLLGDTGTGKEIIANHIYWNSNRVGKPFVKVNAGSIPESLVDSELFGHKKGSFTGAINDKKGVFEQADKGILFLDEISNLDYNIQGKILRAIEYKEIRILGGELKYIDARYIFATNKNLDKLMKEHKFRDDLFYRLEGNIIYIPPLREREDDILLLMKYFFDLASAKHNALLDISLKDIKNELLSYEWPGNVRELQKFCEYVTIMYNTITNTVILNELCKKSTGIEQNNNEIENILSISNYTEACDHFSKKYILYHLAKNNRKISLTAHKLGLDRSTLYKKLKKFNLDFSDS